MYNSPDRHVVILHSTKMILTEATNFRTAVASHLYYTTWSPRRFSFHLRSSHDRRVGLTYGRKSKSTKIGWPLVAWYKHCFPWIPLMSSKLRWDRHTDLISQGLILFP